MLLLPHAERMRPLSAAGQQMSLLGSCRVASTRFGLKWTLARGHSFAELSRCPSESRACGRFFAFATFGLRWFLACFTCLILRIKLFLCPTVTSLALVWQCFCVVDSVGPHTSRKEPSAHEYQTKGKLQLLRGGKSAKVSFG